MDLSVAACGQQERRGGWKVLPSSPLASLCTILTHNPFCREAFSKFLQRYPYCYGYWKKFSDFEKRNGDTARTMEVFEQGLKAIPLSADLWIHFLNHQRAIAAADEMESGGSGNLHVVRQSYERAVAECGREWRSDKLG